jgi:uncharacterized protein involved in response to NO
MAAATGAIHLSQLGVIDLPLDRGIRVGLDVVLLVMAVMGGRVIPMFTNNGVPGAAATRIAWVEKASIASVAVLIAADAFGLGGGALALLCTIAALAHARRWVAWQPWTTLRTPLVWILHVAYSWIPLHLLLRTGAALEWIAPSVATHALTAGAIGGLIIGMMTRTSRGHTGRPLRADRWDVAAYALVTAAAVLRVFVPLFAPQWLVGAVIASSLPWACGFAIFAVHYGPWLLRPRPDGKPG